MKRAWHARDFLLSATYPHKKRILLDSFLYWDPFVRNSHQKRPNKKPRIWLFSVTRPGCHTIPLLDQSL